MSEPFPDKGQPNLPAGGQQEPYPQTPYQQDPYQQDPYQQGQAPAPWQQPPAAPYGATYGQAANNPYDSETTLILVMGILSLVVCGLLGIVAWMQGNSLKKRAEESGWPEPSTGKVGRILGIVGTIIGIMQLAGIAIWLIFVFGMISTASTTG